MTVDDNSSNKITAARKAEWRNIKVNLNEMEIMVPRRTHKYHKQWFFTGELDPIVNRRYAAIKPSNVPDPFDGAQLFFEMWYHPEPSLELFRKLVVNASDYNFRQSRDALTNRFNLGKFSSDYGMLGGREELFVRALYPELDYKNATDTNSRGDTINLSIHPQLCAMFFLGHVIPLLLSDSVNPNAPGQFLMEHFCFGLERYPEQIFAHGDREFREFRLREFCRLVVDFHEREGEAVKRPASIGLRNRIYARFEARDFPEILMTYWDEQKKAYESGEPYPVREIKDD